MPDRWSIFRPGVGAHVILYRMTGGIVGRRVPGLPPMLLLDHVGAKSGKARTTPLAYLEQGDDFVIVASKGGHPKHPSWFHNLRANPETRIQVGPRRIPVTARVATDAEHARLWPKVVDLYSGYADYQKRTDRKIPLVILEPR